MKKETEREKEEAVETIKVWEKNISCEGREK